MTAVTPAHAAHHPADILARAREVVDPILREAVDSLPEPLCRMAGYHFGWWDERGRPVGGRPGKMLRSGLAISACAACGGPPRAAGPAAAAVELVHNFTLVHDDVMDRDVTRRGRPAVWSVWGIADAVLLGDALHALATEVLATRLPRTAAGVAVRRLENTVVELCRGQHEDCRAESAGRTRIADCERIAMGKTGALMGCACALGALCAGAGVAAVATADRFGRELGLAYQLTDDLLGIWGDPEAAGKPPGDLARRKRSMPVVVALLSDTAAATELGDLYRDADRPLSPHDIERAARLVTEAGGRDATRRRAERRIRAALRALPSGAGSADLRALVRLVSERNR
ncbi:geranylgeranyl diphosphate synthase type I [Nocardia transvalensis]|uniref:Geranylgeranyl diphosphate synthase type I n=1 Tax=Nocardia transvalensis TaxID=37333 RepID=A0A7W9PKM7_9NOCA|nr:polyprenyl synthetase family protein [Nocardia transvalensis]MBB5917443.1 geranylgeranyl diphosphate synthase type I [Nocardia transvalensis]